MTAPPMNGNGGPPDMNPVEVPGNVPLPPAADTTDALVALIEGIATLARKSAMDDNAAEAKDYMQAALFAAQAQAVLDPNKTQTGTPLDHEVKLAQLNQQGALNLEAQRGANQASAAKVTEKATGDAAAPSPGKQG